MKHLRETVEEAKEHLPLPELMRLLNLGEHARKSACCPLHEDQSPSFSVWQSGQGWRWKCHAGCGEGDEIDFLAAYREFSLADALRQFIEMAGSGTVAPQRPMTGGSHDTPRIVQLPPDFRPCTRSELEIVATSRRLSLYAIDLAASLGVIHFGTVCGEASWILTDARRICAEARTLTGTPFPALARLPERKAHTLRGSRKSWPVGIVPRKGIGAADFAKIMLVEGGPDLLAALHFLLERHEYKTLPVAMLGRAAGQGGIHGEALPHFAGKRVRIYPHADMDEGGLKAAQTWAAQLVQAGAEIDAFSFAGLTRKDGQAVNDLNDAALISPEQADELSNLLP